jgi:competence protein ComFC
LGVDCLLKQRQGVFFRAAQRFAKSATSFFSPSSIHCIYCHNSIRNRSDALTMGLCDSCRQSIPWIREVICGVCGRYEACNDCTRRKHTYFNYNRSAVQYSDDMRNWLARYKYRGDEKLLPLFVEMLRYPYERLVQEIACLIDHKFDLITYIPLSAERLSERGFNQAKQLAEGLGELYRTPVLPLLERTHHTGKQSYKTRGQRLDDLQGAFAFYSNETLLKPFINMGRPINVLLLDDVYTTGSTLNQCASVIQNHISAQIFGLTWAR